MKRTLFGLTVFVLGLAAVVQAQPTVVLGPGLGSGRVNYYQTWDRNLSADTIYIITGTYFVQPGFRLNIAAGTVIQGDTASSLVIRPSGRIYAIGSPTNPIVFTSRKVAGQRAPGDWGGLVVLGNAPTNQSSPQIEGGIIPGAFGGSAPGVGDVHDTSGVLQYIRIEFAGYRYQLNNEINGLTVGGVGDGTVIDHIEVAYAYDDSFEFFGGTVNAKYLVAFGGTDDEFDTDWGFSGRLQFCLGYRDPYIWDPTGESNGFESDNMEPSSGWTTDPRTRVKMANITLIGPRRTDATTYIPGNRFQYNVVERRGSEHRIYNSILMGYPGGYSLRDNPTFDAAIAGAKETRNTSLANNGDLGFKLLDPRLSSPYDSTQFYTWISTGAFNNLGVDQKRLPSAIKLVDMSNFSNPDPRPSLSSEAVNSAAWTSSLLLANGTDSAFFDRTVTYRGAFDPSKTMAQQWTAGWTKFDYAETGTTPITMNNGWNLVSVSRGVTDFTPMSVFPGAETGTIYSYDGTNYVNPTTLQSGVGYWALYTSTPTVNQTGLNLPGVSVPVNGIAVGATRWVIFGTPSVQIPVTKIATSLAGRMEPGTVYGYNGTSYVTPTQLDPGKAYWVLCNGGVAGTTAGNFVLAIGQ
jgi:hypothetical protein